ncbi:MAG TPA: peptide ABC transporter substrate-binding protein [Chloroflexota bacterium]
MMRRFATKPMLFMAIAFLAGACSPASSAVTQVSPPAPARVGPKVLTIALTREPNGFVISLSASASTSGGAIQAQNLPANKLQNIDEKGQNYPELAEAIPSTTAGSWKINPDGTMETTWKLRPNIRWHDGEPVTADDLVFGYQAATAPGVPSLGAAYLRNISDVVAQDSLTALVKWSKPSPAADTPGDNLPILPKHLLESELAKGATSFMQLPYWTSAFVGNGPFKLDQWLPGDQLQFSAFDGYFRGRPKLDRVIIRVVPDTNTQVANLLAGEIDMTLPVSIDTETALSIQERWAGTGNQVLLASPGNLRSFLPNSHPEYQTPRELLDPRYRQALYRSVDRQAMSDLVTRGNAPIADSLLPAQHPLRAPLESAIVRYPYDVGASMQALSDLGWSRAPDGVLRNADGREFRFKVWNTAEARAEREMNSAIAGWKQMGIQIEEVLVPATLIVSDEDRLHRDGISIIGGIADEFLADRLSCDTIPTAANTFRGRNSGAWCSPQAQTFIDQLRVTIPQNQRIELQRGLLGVIGTELPIMPLYWDIDPILVLAAVKNVPLPSAPTRISTFNIWAWDKE